MGRITKQLRRTRRELNGARLYAGLSGSSLAYATIARLERLSWRLERALELEKRRAA